MPNYYQPLTGRAMRQMWWSHVLLAYWWQLAGAQRGWVPAGLNEHVYFHDQHERAQSLWVTSTDHWPLERWGLSSAQSLRVPNMGGLEIKHVRCAKTDSPRGVTHIDPVELKSLAEPTLLEHSFWRAGIYPFDVSLYTVVERSYSLDLLKDCYD